MKEEPPSSAKCRDKFLVQSTIITPDRENTQIADLWGLVEQENKSAIHEQKIRCAFLPPATAPVPEEEECSQEPNGDEKYTTVRGGVSNSASEAYNSITAASNATSRSDGNTTDKARTAVAAAGGTAATGAGAAYTANRNAIAGGFNGSSNGARGTSSTAAASSATKSSSELQAEINRLRAQVADLKKKSGGEMATATDAGVPVHIVAAIAFGVFAITYLFF